MRNRYLLYFIQSSMGYSGADARRKASPAQMSGALGDLEGRHAMTKATWIAPFMAILGAVGSATAQGYPIHPITIVVPFAAGGPTDALARIVAERMAAKLG